MFWAGFPSPGPSAELRGVDSWHVELRRPPDLRDQRRRTDAEPLRLDDPQLGGPVRRRPAGPLGRRTAAVLPTRPPAARLPRGAARAGRVARRRPPAARGADGRRRDARRGGGGRRRDRDPAGGAGPVRGRPGRVPAAHRGVRGRRRGHAGRGARRVRDPDAGARDRRAPARRRPRRRALPRAEAARRGRGDRDLGPAARRRRPRRRRRRLPPEAARPAAPGVDRQGSPRTERHHGVRGAARMTERLPSGIEPLDRLLHGGLPAKAITLLVGPPGSGKTMLAQQYMFENATRERPGLYLSTVSEPFEKVIRFGQTLTFFDGAAVGDAIFFEDLASALLEGGLDAVLERTDALLREHRPGI